MKSLRFGLGVLAMAAAAPAWAHTGVGAPGGFAAGVLHPLSGVDHMLAMVAVGLWAGLVGGRAVWLWPLAFVGLMAGGALLGIGGAPMPGVEIGIALSVLLLGVAAAARLSPPLAAGAALCGIFALFHGHAHGAELPGVSTAGYLLGFVFATAALHALGIVLAGLPKAAAWLPRMIGGAIAGAGAVLLIG